MPTRDRQDDTCQAPVPITHSPTLGMRLVTRYAILAFIAVVVVNLINLALNLQLSRYAFAVHHLAATVQPRAALPPTADPLAHRLYHRNRTAKHAAHLDLMPRRLRELPPGLPVTITAEEFRKQPRLKTGNPLVDTYGENDPLLSGELGKGVVFGSRDKEAAAALTEEFKVNVMSSDVIPLNRMVPDSRLFG